jgi:hypothetical protein
MTRTQGGPTRHVRRRAFLAEGAAGVVMAATPLAGAAAHGEDEGVTAPEDLMKEHGVLNRCLLIDEEGIRRVQAKVDVSPQVFHQTGDLVRRFVEGYHEKNEEHSIFPVFQKAGKMTALVSTLLAQHQAGRAVTAQILPSRSPTPSRTPRIRSRSLWPVSGLSACIAPMRRERTRCSSPLCAPS